MSKNIYTNQRKQYEQYVLTSAKGLEWSFFFTANGHNLELEWRKKIWYHHYNKTVKHITVDFFYQDTTGDIKIAIECDDSSHLNTKIEDAVRDKNLEDKGIKVFRFSTKEITWNCAACVEKVKKFIENERRKHQIKSYERKFTNGSIKKIKVSQI